MASDRLPPNGEGSGMAMNSHSGGRGNIFGIARVDQLVISLDVAGMVFKPARSPL